MNRRDFLKNLFIAGAAAATPKLIFDMGANSHIYTRTSFEGIFKLYEELKTKGLVIPFNPDWKEAPYEEISWSLTGGFVSIDNDPFRRLHLVYPKLDLSGNPNYKRI